MPRINSKESARQYKPHQTNNPSVTILPNPKLPENEPREIVKQSPHPVRRGWDYHGF